QRSGYRKRFLETACPQAVEERATIFPTGTWACRLHLSRPQRFDRIYNAGTRCGRTDSAATFALTLRTAKRLQDVLPWNRHRLRVMEPAVVNRKLAALDLCINIDEAFAETDVF